MIAAPINAVVKTCGCGAAYDAETWAALPFVGFMGALGRGEKRTIELRNCACLSTLAVEVVVPEARAA